jgi:hypothetical protein
LALNVVACVFYRPFTSWITSCSASRFKRATQIVQMIVKDNLPQTRHFDFEDAS